MIIDRSVPATLQSLAESRFLAALPRTVQEDLLPGLERTEIAFGKAIYEPGEPLEYIYFPTSCIVSLVYTTENGMTAEVGMIGKEGVVGIALFTGGETMPNRAVVQRAGQALRMRANLLAHLLRNEFKRCVALELRFLRYIQALLTQIAQTAVCNRMHSVEQRLCRWLLLCHDRTDCHELRMTQEFIANMLGGRRQSIVIAAGHLQEAGLIYYSRGHIIIRNRLGLEAATCECYQVVKAESDRLLCTTHTDQLRQEPPGMPRF